MSHVRISDSDSARTLKTPAKAPIGHMLLHRPPPGFIHKLYPCLACCCSFHGWNSSEGWSLVLPDILILRLASPAPLDFYEKSYNSTIRYQLENYSQNAFKMVRKSVFVWIHNEACISKVHPFITRFCLPTTIFS